MDATLAAVKPPRATKALNRTVDAICFGVFKGINIMLTSLYICNIVLINMANFLPKEVKELRQIDDLFHLTANYVWLLLTIVKFYWINEQPVRCIAAEISCTILLVFSGLLKIVDSRDESSATHYTTVVLENITTSEYVCLVCILELHCFSFIALFIQQYHHTKAVKRDKVSSVSQKTELYVIDTQLNARQDMEKSLESAKDSQTLEAPSTKISAKKTKMTTTVQKRSSNASIRDLNQVSADHILSPSVHSLENPKVRKTPSRKNTYLFDTETSLDSDKQKDKSSSDHEMEEISSLFETDTY